VPLWRRCSNSLDFAPPSLSPKICRGAARDATGGGVPDEKHPWVNTPPAAFREYMTYLKQNGYRTLALRDLRQYYDSANLPDDPLLKARCCAK